MNRTYTFRRAARAVAAILLLSAAAFGLAEGLPRLPADFTFPQEDASQKKVVFSHKSHVDADKPGCTDCHPALFKMLVPGTRADGKPAVGMDSHEACATCHDEKAKKSVITMEACDQCHVK